LGVFNVSTKYFDQGTKKVHISYACIGNFKQMMYLLLYIIVIFAPSKISE